MGRESGLQPARILSPPQCEKIRQERMAGRREYRFRVELDPPRGQRPMSHSHEGSIGCPGQRNEFRRKGVRIDDKRVVSGHRQWRRQAGE